jgi:hypothetical protein
MFDLKSLVNPEGTTSDSIKAYARTGTDPVALERIYNTEKEANPSLVYAMITNNPAVPMHLIEQFAENENYLVFKRPLPEGIKLPKLKIKIENATDKPFKLSKITCANLDLVGSFEFDDSKDVVCDFLSILHAKLDVKEICKTKAKLLMSRVGQVDTMGFKGRHHQIDDKIIALIK